MLMDISSLSLAEIERRVRNSQRVEQEFLDALRRDRRSGARELLSRYLDRVEREAAEAARIRAMYRQENALAVRGLKPVAGLDEAGRGPIAGPVVAAAVILPPGVIIPGLNDSKKIPPARRAVVAAEVMTAVRSWAVALASVREIEQHNILGATFLAMRRAVRLLREEPAWLLVDGNVPISGISTPQTTVIHGDAECASIAAASVLAKVWRDELMTRCHCTFPDYGFDQHKGYGTAGHYECLRRLGATPIHRWNLGSGL